MPIRVDDHIHKIGVLERCSGAVVGGLVKRPRWRPKFPKQATQLVAPGRKSRTAPLGVEVVLIPQAPLLVRIGGLQRLGDILDLVATAGPGPTHALWRPG